MVEIRFLTCGELLTIALALYPMDAKKKALRPLAPSPSRRACSPSPLPTLPPPRPLSLASRR